MLIALLCSTALSACLPEEKDPGKVSDAGKLNGDFYASSLGNLAVQIQNRVVGDPTWFTSTSGNLVTLANMGIENNINGSEVKSMICPTGSGTEVLHLTWIDGRGSDNHFKAKGIGTDTGAMIGALRERVAGDQVGTYNGGTSLETASGTTVSIPSSCASISIPVGAPVLAFRIERPAAPVSQLSRTEYRTVDCPTDIRGMKQRGTQVQSRKVSFNSDGTMVTYNGNTAVPLATNPDAGWSTDSLGACVSDVIVTATSSTQTNAGSVLLNNFADVAASSLKQTLENQLKMDCSTASISSDVVKKNEAGQDVRNTTGKNMSSCTVAQAAAATSTLTDTAQTTLADTRDVCVEKGTVSVRSFLSVPTGTLTSNLSGTAYVDRIIEKVALSSDSTNRGEREKWVGRPAISCTSADTYVANCNQVPGAPSGPDLALAGSKWNYRDVSNYGNNEAWYNKMLGFCFIGCTYATGGGAYTLNWNYFNSKQTLHGPTSTTTAVGSRFAADWTDRFTYFTPNFQFQPFTVPAATNQCLIRTREIQLNCPLSYDGSKQAGWYPYELGAGSGYYTTLIPGGSYGGDVGGAYNSVRNSGDTPGLVWLNWKECNIKGCNYWTDYAGPGTDAYIKSWTYYDTSSYSGAGTTVQTIMMNKEGQMADYQPAIFSGPSLRYKGTYTVPLHCGRIERRDFSWPGYVLQASCGGKGGCSYWWAWSPVTISEVIVREWSGSDSVNGTWSQPSVYYTSAYGSWSSLGAIPGAIYH
ncbi:MAG: hypothetical protein KGQ41_02860 [Alphaproteobacteria bacterium]|nr:hypothetical protein [Alphaproteobacteria bacterium]